MLLALLCFEGGNLVVQALGRWDGLVEVEMVPMILIALRLHNFALGLVDDGLAPLLDLLEFLL